MQNTIPSFWFNKNMSLESIKTLSILSRENFMKESRRKIACLASFKRTGKIGTSLAQLYLETRKETFFMKTMFAFLHNNKLAFLKTLETDVTDQITSHEDVWLFYRLNYMNFWLELLYESLWYYKGLLYNSLLISFRTCLIHLPKPFLLLLSILGESFIFLNRLFDHSINIIFVFIDISRFSIRISIHILSLKIVSLIFNSWFISWNLIFCWNICWLHCWGMLFHSHLLDLTKPCYVSAISCHKLCY